MQFASEQAGPAARTDSPGGAQGRQAAASAPWPRRLRRLPGLVPLRSFAVFLLAWHLFALWNANPIQLPAPMRVFAALYDLALDSELLENALVSAGRLAVSRCHTAAD